MAAVAAEARRGAFKAARAKMPAGEHDEIPPDHVKYTEITFMDLLGDEILNPQLLEDTQRQLVQFERDTSQTSNVSQSVPQDS